MDEQRFRNIAAEIEKEFEMGGLSGGLYYDYAFACARRYIASQQPDSSADDSRCIHCGAGDDIHHSFSCPTGLHPDSPDPESGYLCPVYEGQICLSKPIPECDCEAK